MYAEPHIVQRTAQPYLAIAGRVTMRTIPEIADRMPEVFAFMADRGLVPAGPPFFRYHLIDMERELEIEVGVPLAEAAPTEAVPSGGDVHPGVLPAGRYATVLHIGHFDELVSVTAHLLAWARRQGLRWDAADSPEGQRWGARLEFYRTDPREEPDPTKWETELAFRLA